MNKKAIEAVALSIRSLAMDAVQAAKSGHPGMPMGMAEVGALLYGEILRHHPGDWKWPNRDRFVLSAGHGSMFLYSLLHMSGYKVTLDDIKHFRQVGSRTPGHPEYGHTEGVETTTGPLGQGLTNAIGFAIAQEMMAGRFNTPKHRIIDHFIYSIVGDGDLMEGVSAEASSLAGHLKLGKLIAFYDSNRISIEGSTGLAFTEDVGKRYDAYGWQTLHGDAYDIDGILKLVEQAKSESGRPSLILLHSVIAKGAPHLAGSAKAHGEPLGVDEVKATKKSLGIPEEAQFYIHPDVAPYFEQRRGEWKKAYDQWQSLFAEWAKANPALKAEWDAYRGSPEAALKTVQFKDYKLGDSLATRQASGEALQALSRVMSNLVGGSADLAPSNNTAIPDYGDFSVSNPTGRTLHFGVREHGMGGISNGIALYGGLRPFCATFLVFSDYMRPSVRLASIMKIPVVYIYTHDSIFLGEDGPTHQPVEHLSALRAIPGFRLLRPGDAQETVEAWKMAIERSDGPTALALTRQKLPVYDKADIDWRQNIRKGAYVALDCDGTPDAIVVATGSEVSLAIDSAKASGRKVRVVSMISRELFLSQNMAFRRQLIPAGVRTIVAEAGVATGWEGIATEEKDLFTLKTFGASGPGNAVAESFHFTQEALVSLIQMQV